MKRVKSCCKDHWVFIPFIALYRDNCLEIAEKAFGGHHSKVAQALFDLGQLYFKQKKYKEAEDYLRRSLVIREITLGAGKVYWLHCGVTNS